MSPYALNIGVNSFTLFTARRKQNLCCSGRAFSGLTSWFTFIFASTDEQMFHSIGVQNPKTKNAFSEAQKYIIISVILKGFSSCLPSEFSSTHLSLSTQQDLKDYSEHGQNWLKLQISIYRLNHHFESQMYFLSLVIAYNSHSQP